MDKLDVTSIEESSTAARLRYKKYKQMILAYLELAFLEDEKMTKIKLGNLLYLADFAWYYHKLESMSGTQYLYRVYGPVSDSYPNALDELEEDGRITVDPKGDMILVSIAAIATPQKLDLLNNDELELVKKIFKKWKNKGILEIVDFIHNQLPCRLCASGEVISYELITQEDPESIY